MGAESPSGLLSGMRGCGDRGFVLAGQAGCGSRRRGAGAGALAREHLAFAH
jgi:hypothetical protein